VATKEAQISVRLPEDLDRWVEEQAGGKRQKPAFIRKLLERERHAEEEAALQRMFDEAWDSLSDEERAEVEAERGPSLTLPRLHTLGSPCAATSRGERALMCSANNVDGRVVL